MVFRYRAGKNVDVIRIGAALVALLVGSWMLSSTVGEEHTSPLAISEAPSMYVLHTSAPMNQAEIGQIVAAHSPQLTQPSEKLYLPLRTRRFIPAVPSANDEYLTERDSQYAYSDDLLDLDRTALVLVDVLRQHPNKGFERRMLDTTKKKVLPLLQLARENKMLVIHAPHHAFFDYSVEPLPGEINLDDENISSAAEFSAFLEKKNIINLLYAGYAVNYCLIDRPDGIIRMRDFGYNIFVVRDCTLAFETPDSLDGQWALRMSINTIEHQWGRSTTLADLSEGFRQYRSEHADK